MVRKGFLLFFIVLAQGTVSEAQTPPSFTSAELFLRLNKLNVLGGVLYVAAHPDDENSRLIPYMSKERLYRTGYLSMTRGDGGQNLIGDEQGVELGLIRTQEMLAARRIDGAEQFFTRAFDFGFTKTTEEALRTWNKEKILSDVVWVIRKFQPDIIITRFPEDGRAGHGHHSASAVLAHEAFAAAADPNRFPEQLKYGVKPWQAKRLLWNTFNFGGTNTTADDQLKLDVGVYNAVLGKSYGEIAAESRTQHKSQGAALTPARGQSTEFFTLVAGDPAKTDPMEGIETTWKRISGGEKVQQLVDQLIATFSLKNPALSVPGLVALYKQMQQLPDGFWKTKKLQEVQQLVEACSGLWLEATVNNGYAVQGDSLSVNFVMNNRLTATMSVNKISMKGLDTNYMQTLVSNKNFMFSKKIGIAVNTPATQPYWLAEDMSAGSFNVSNQQLIGEPQGRPSYEVTFTIRVEGTDFTFTRPVQYKYTDPVKGEIFQPLTILPPVTGQFNPELVLFTNGEEKTFQVQTKNQNNHKAEPSVFLTDTKEIGIKETVNLHNNITYTARPQKNAGNIVYTALMLRDSSRRDTVMQLKTIAYDHIPRIDFFRKSVEKFVIADVKTSGRRIGYIEGAGDKVQPALVQMGYEVILLKEKDIVAANLSQFDAIITGVRAYDVHEWLSDKYDVFMNYVKEGGNLVVQYNRINRAGNSKVNIGPYPFSISNNRVTDENAEVVFTKPDHPVLNFPNKITSKDFEGWIQERGIYFINQLDPKYETILSMHDAGEAEQTGSLVVGDFGKGKFVYTGLVFFRELPAGVPGAYRLLANIIALNHKKAF